MLQTQLNIITYIIRQNRAVEIRFQISITMFSLPEGGCQKFLLACKICQTPFRHESSFLSSIEALVHLRLLEAIRDPTFQRFHMPRIENKTLPVKLECSF